MTPQEVICNFRKNLDIWKMFENMEDGFSDEQIIQMMKEYATLCCEAQLKKVVNNYNSDFNNLDELESSILNTPITLL